MNTLTCRCNTVEPTALWSYCEDDWYCPQCGETLCWLSSTEQYPPDDNTPPVRETELWVYPDRNGKFLVRLFLHYPSRERTQLHGAPSNLLAELRNALDFECRVLPPQPGGATMIELAPRNANQQFVPVPKDGLRCTLKVTGDFPPTIFSLRVCQAPQLRWEVQGRGIRRNDSSGGSGWLVQRREWLDLRLQLISEEAPVKLAETSTEADLHPAFDPRATPPEFKLLEAPPAGSELSEGHPAAWRLRVDVRNFNSVGQILKLSPKWQLAGGQSPRLPIIEMQYVPSAILFEPHELAVSHMYWGEVRSNNWANRDENPDDDPGLPHVVGELLIRNDGEKSVKLKRPDVPAHDKDGSERWLETDWLPAAHADENGFVELAPQSSAPLFVRFNFRQPSALQNCSVLDPVDPGPRGTIRVIAADDTDFWPVTIQVGRLLPRKPCPFPLAIDFGNSFSYAAVLNEGIIRDLSDPIIGVHDRFALEEFPTILAVRRFVPDHPLQSEFVVGTFAQAVSSDNDGLGWPVTDLKSWLGQDDGDQERPVIDAGQMTYYVRVSVLVQMFLYGVIQRAEAIFRQYFVAKIVTSYPAKLTPHARRRWLSLVDDVCMQISKEREPRNQPIEHCHAQVDEANAVATGFVLDNEQRQYELADHEHGQDGFVVAAFDLGGGSLDTALLRFRIDNPDGGIGIYASKYLGIGGQPDFGGDNVTIAVMELLCDRIASRLPTSRLSETLLANLPSPQNHFQTAGPSRGLYEALWTAADWFKRSLCEQAVGAAAGPLQLSVNSPDPHVRAFIELLHATLKDPQFRPSLDEVYRHPIRADQHGKGSYTVEQRLAVSIDELATFAKNKSVTVDYVVLGGNSSRIPLAQDLLKLSFPDAQIVFNPKRLKCRVAEGLVRTIYYLDGVGPSLALSGQCTTRSIGVLVNGTGEPVVIIPACTPVDPSQRFPLVAKNGKSIALRRVALSGRLAVYTDVEHRRFRREIGSFDLGKLSVPITDATTMVALRFVGSDEESLQLLIEMEGQMQALDLGHSRS